MADREQTFDMCLREMFRRVGMRHSKKFCKQDNWYQLRTWTDEECNDFERWMTVFLRKRHRWPKMLAQKETGWFVMMYGWSRPPNGCLAVSGRRRPVV